MLLEIMDRYQDMLAALGELVVAPLLDKVMPLVAAEATTADEMDDDLASSSNRGSQKQPTRESKRNQSNRNSTRGPREGENGGDIQIMSGDL